MAIGGYIDGTEQLDGTLVGVTAPTIGRWYGLKGMARVAVEITKTGTSTIDLEGTFNPTGGPVTVIQAGVTKGEYACVYPWVRLHVTAYTNGVISQAAFYGRNRS